MTIFKSLAVDSFSSLSPPKQPNKSRKTFLTIDMSCRIQPPSGLVLSSEYIVYINSVMCHDDEWNNKSYHNIIWSLARHYHDVSSLENVRIASCVQHTHITEAHMYEPHWWVTTTFRLLPTHMKYEEWNMSFAFVVCDFCSLLFVVRWHCWIKPTRPETEMKIQFIQVFFCLCVLFALIYSSNSGSLSLSSTWWIDTRHEDFKLISITQRESAAHSYRDLRSFTSSLWINSSIKPLLDWFRCHVKFDRTWVNERAARETVQPVIKQPSYGCSSSSSVSSSVLGEWELIVNERWKRNINR